MAAVVAVARLGWHFWLKENWTVMISVRLFGHRRSIAITKTGVMLTVLIVLSVAIVVTSVYSLISIPSTS